ncbi:hypothetical protein RND81_08G035300 [Saponaria officinalis]|uniref:HAT C-terminal dimerisation domain-containing protein n=1 Tax=Saponaria officinalis TaxID=3572 RepID=A0AAW1J4Y5_SAPOF
MQLSKVIGPPTLRFPLENSGGTRGLQLALIAASRDVISVYQFFSMLTFIRLLEREELETGKEKNQIVTIKRAGDTRWGSHFGSLNSLLNMYNASCSVLQTVIKEGKGAQREEADKAYDDMTSFEFVLITNDLCQALQRKSQDILNAMHLVSNTKILIQKLRDDGWENLLQQVLLFCNNHNIEVSNMEDHYIYGRERFRQPKDRVFIAVRDSQLHELDFRFNDEMIELLSLSSSLDPKRKFQNFKAADFTEQEKLNLKILTIPVSTTTVECAFSAMKLIKTTLHNRMEDDYLTNLLIVYVEKGIAKEFDIDSIIDEFASKKDRRSLLKISKTNK